MTRSNQESELERLETEFRSLLAFAEELDVVPSTVAASGRVRGFPVSWFTEKLVRRLADNARGKMSLVSSMLDGARSLAARGADPSVLLHRLPTDLARMDGYLRAISDLRSEKSAIGNSAKKAAMKEWQQRALALYVAKKWHSKTQAASAIAPKVKRLPDTVKRFLYTLKEDEVAAAHGAK